jgi:hypothetical protein
MVTMKDVNQETGIVRRNCMAFAEPGPLPSKEIPVKQRASQQT